MDPQTHQRAEERPRPKSTFSFRSDRSGSTAKSSKRETLVESHEEKRKTYLSSTTKANPNAAITELQPSKSSVGLSISNGLLIATQLRLPSKSRPWALFDLDLTPTSMEIQSVSRQVLVLIVLLLTVSIAEPDLSNPTRPRWERPLDTIRSFEAAIDAEYKTRQTLLRPGLVSLPTLRNWMVAHNHL